MDDKIIQINCFGKVEEIIISLKDVLSKLEDAYQKDAYVLLDEGKTISSNTEKVVLRIIK